MVCSELAGLVWAETPKLAAPQGVLDVLSAARFTERAQAETELMLALGATVFKLYVSGGKIGLDFVQPDRFIPVSWDAGVITEADIIDRRVSTRSNTSGSSDTGKDGEATRLQAKSTNSAAAICIRLHFRSLDSQKPRRPARSRCFFYCGNPEANNLDTDSPLSISNFRERTRHAGMFGHRIRRAQLGDCSWEEAHHRTGAGIAPCGNTETGKAEKYFDPSDEVFQGVRY